VSPRAVRSGRLLRLGALGAVAAASVALTQPINPFGYYDRQDTTYRPTLVLTWG
jgi:hypothetical protein